MSDKQKILLDLSNGNIFVRLARNDVDQLVPFPNCRLAWSKNDTSSKQKTK